MSDKLLIKNLRAKEKKKVEYIRRLKFEQRFWRDIVREIYPEKMELFYNALDDLLKNQDFTKHTE